MTYPSQESEARRELDPEILTRVIDGWFVVGVDEDGAPEKWRLVPMSEDGGLSVTSPASWFAEAIAAEYRRLIEGAR